MAKKKDKKATPISAWDNHVIEAQNALVQRDEKYAKRIKWTRRALYSSIPLTLLMAFVMFIYLGGSQNEVEQEAVSSYTVNSVEGKDVAMQALTAWLDTEPTPLDRGRILSWDGAEDEGILSLDKDGAQTGEVNAHYFTVIDSKGLTYRTMIKTLYVKNEGSSVLTEPTLLPILQNKSSEHALPLWTGFETFQVTEPIANVVKQFAKAYMGADADLLKITISDPDTEHVYPTFPYGMTSISAQINECGQKEGNTVCNVTILYKNPRIKDNEETKDKKAYVTYDLLLQDVDTGAPKVVAWGASGEGDKLVPYENAIEGSEYQAQESEGA
jgi:hypothetical protein